MIAPETQKQDERRAKHLRHRREWEANNRERVIAYRLRTYRNILERAGYVVIQPKETEADE